MRGYRKALDKVTWALDDAAMAGMFNDTDVQVPSLATLVTDAALEGLFPQKEHVPAAFPWKTNADLLYDVWRCGYVEGEVYDATPGTSSKGMWWRRLVTHSEFDMHFAEGIDNITLNGYSCPLSDFRDTPFDDEQFDTVAYDPPYKLNGNPQGLRELSQRYGVHIPTPWQQRHELMVAGFIEMMRISKRFVLVKCQDQVCSGEVRWQTQMFYDYAKAHEFRQADRFDMLGHHIPQPMAGRKQRHAHARPSTLLVFERK